MNTLIIMVIVFVLVFVYSLNHMQVKTILMLQNPEEMIQKIDLIYDQGFQNYFSVNKKWTEENGYEHECFFTTRTVDPNMTISSSVWWSSKDRTYAVIYYAKTTKFIEFATRYDGSVGVSTASSKDAVMLPNMPGQYVQSFTRLSIDELYQKHLEARELVEKYENVSSYPHKQDLFKGLYKHLIDHSSYLMSLPFWRMKGVYWYFIRRNLKVNKPITIPKDY